MSSRIVARVALSCLLGATARWAAAQSPTAFTYQGRLEQASGVVNAACDLKFSLWDAASGGGLASALQPVRSVAVTDGLFTLPDLDFGAGAFSGPPRWLEVAVRCGAETAFTTFAARQALTPTPYAIFAQTARDLQGNLRVLSPAESSFATDPTYNTYLYVQPVSTGDSSGYVRLGAFDSAGSVQGGRDLALAPAGGNVGIGTTAPGARLDVVGPGGGGVVAAIEQPDGINFVDLRSANGGSNYGSILRFLDGGVVNAQISSTADGSLRLWAGGADRLTVRPTGEVLVDRDLQLASDRTEIRGFDGAGFHWFGRERTSDLAFGIKYVGPNNYVFEVHGDVVVHGDLEVGGSKHFVIADPRDATQEIVYTALEGPEAGTYLRGTAQLRQGVAVIDLPEHFPLTTSEDGLTVQLTPLGEPLRLFVAEKTTRRIRVREADGRSGRFDYLIQGVRTGHEGAAVIRPRKRS